jgi:cytochrome c peroxidase
MHAGQAKTLPDAIDFYNHAPGHAVSDRSDLTLHWHVVDPQLRTDEMVDLVAFLNTLTDETAMPVIPDRGPSGLPVPR